MPTAANNNSKDKNIVYAAFVGAHAVRVLKVIN